MPSCRISCLRSELGERDRLQEVIAENEQLRVALRGVTAWRDQSWSPKGITLVGLPKSAGRDLDAEIEKARTETEAAWSAARAALLHSKT